VHVGLADHAVLVEEQHLDHMCARDALVVDRNAVDAAQHVEPLGSWLSRATSGEWKITSLVQKARTRSRSFDSNAATQCFT
jgi:hypothetical protein